MTTEHDRRIDYIELPAKDIAKTDPSGNELAVWGE